MPHIRFTLIGLLPWIALPAMAQTQPVTASTETGGGLQTAVFQTPAGTIRANLPDDVAAGDTISGTVTAEPSGSNPEERSANSATLTGYVVEIEHHPASPKERRLSWLVPPTANALSVLLRDPAGHVVSHRTIPVAPQAAPDPAQVPAAPDDFDMPSVGQPMRSYAINGRFTGDARNTAVSLGGKPAEVLAESPRRAVFQVPDGITGSTRIELRERDLALAQNFRVLQVILAGNTDLIRGQRSELTIKVSGLQGITEPAEMTLANTSPGVVLISGAQVQHFQIAPREVGPDGVYLTTRTMTGVMRGAFNISAFVREQPLDRFDTRRTVAATLARWQENTGIAISSRAQVLIERSVRDAKNELNRLLKAQSERAAPQSLVSALVRSYCFQLRDYQRGILTAAAPASPPSPARSTLVHAFLGAPAAGPQSITEQDVAKHSFADFLSRLVATLSGSMELAEMEVCSEPDAALIVIDSKRMGSTNASFVVSLGHHEVSINGPAKSCNIKATAGQDQIVSCPKNASCKLKRPNGS